MSDLSLIEAVKTGDYAEVEMLTKLRADINQQDEHGWSPLRFTAGRGDLPLVKLPVECGADIFKVGRDQSTPLAVALAAGRVPIIERLSEFESRFHQVYVGRHPVRVTIDRFLPQPWGSNPER